MTLFYPINERAIKAFIVGEMLRQDPNAVIQKGSIFDLFLNANSSVGNSMNMLFSAATAQAFLGTASGEYLDALGALVGFDRQASTKATGEVTFSRDTAATADWDIPTGTQVGTAPDANGNVIVFLTTEDAILLTGETSVDVAVEAKVAGTTGNVGSATVISQVTPLSFAPYVSNTTAFEGGADQELDEDYRDRLIDGIKNNTGKTSVSGYKKTVLGVDNIDSVLIKTQEEYQRTQWKCEATTGWATTGNAASLTTSADESEGTNALSFAKTSGTASAGIVNTFTADDWSNKRGRFRAKIKFSSAADAAKVLAVTFIATDSTAKTLTTVAVGTPTDIYSTFYGDLDTPDSETGGFDISSIVSLEIRLTTVATTSTLTGVLVDDVKIIAKPNQINVYFTVTDTANGIPTTEQIAEVLAEMTSDDNKAPCDDIAVFAPTAIEADITAVLILKPDYDSTTVIAAVEENLSQYINSQEIGSTLYLTQIDAVMQDTEGVLTFTRSAPVANISFGETEKIVSGTLDITV